MGGVSWLAQCALNFLVDERCHACGVAFDDTPADSSCPELATPVDVLSTRILRLKTRLLCVACAGAIRFWPGRVILPGAGCDNTPVVLFPVFVTDERLLVLIHLLKFARRERIAPWLASAMARRLPDFSEWGGQAHMVVPVPMDRAAQTHRGFNQAERIARALAHEWNLSLPSRALIKVRRTRPQSTLGRDERLVNVEGAFRVDGGRVRDAKVIIVDDLVTTGATVRSCARALRAAGAREVVAVCAGYRDQTRPDQDVLPQS